MENLTYNEQTMHKVLNVLVRDGHHTASEAAELISAMQNEGIKFRESHQGDVGAVRGVDLDLEAADLASAVYQAIGAASTCWDSEGVFDDQCAAQIGQQLLDRINSEWLKREEAGAGIRPVPMPVMDAGKNEERRVWAISRAIEAMQQAIDFDQNDILKLAAEFETFAKGTNPDLNDVDATDTFYLMMGMNIEETFGGGDTNDVDIEQFLIDMVDMLAKNGVRIKDGAKLEAQA